ncbi:hypothetical protein ACQ4M3_14670 [Leptolyngbya sp. AN03gr2]|uniref:hypothetical protein n=1 Tax=unclassified Leptolyngbya TaxID=2650499 RepID=UPI003D317EDE
MARPKRTSRVLVQAEQREAGLKTIDSELKLGDELSLSGYSELIQKLRDQLATYNATLSTLDELTRDIEATEKTLRDRSERMLSGVAAQYGKDSNEYGKAGGKLKSERRRPTPKNKPVEPLPVEESPVSTVESLEMLLAALKDKKEITATNGNGSRVGLNS